MTAHMRIHSCAHRHVVIAMWPACAWQHLNSVAISVIANWGACVSLWNPRLWVLLQVAQRYAATVAPFLASCPRTADVLPPSDESTQALYLWATAIISSYSFTIGSDRWIIPPFAKYPTLHQT